MEKQEIIENKIKMLIVDDETQICEVMEAHFKRRGYEVFTATSGKQAIDLARANNPQILLLDKRMPEMDGIQTLRAIRQFNQALKVIMISADKLDSETENLIKALNVSEYLHKPMIMSILDAMVEKLSKAIKL